MTPGSWGGKNLKKAVGSANCLLKKFAGIPATSVFFFSHVKVFKCTSNG